MSALSNDYPITRDPDEVIVGDCDRLEGGVKLPGSPVFTPLVLNEGDPLWRDDDLALVQEDNGDTILIDDA